MRGDVTHLDPPHPPLSVYLSCKGQGSPPESRQPTAPLRLLCQVLHISPYESIGDKMVIFLAAKGLLFVSVRSNALLLLSVRSNGCFSPSQRGPIVLEGDSDMVRYPCMLSLWVDSCPEAVCEALMVPHFHWIWCFGSCATDVFVFFSQQQKK